MEKNRSVFYLHLKIFYTIMTIIIKKAGKRMLKVLIADEEPRVGLLIKQLVQWDKLGLRLAGMYTDGKSALDGIEKERPDIVITDIRMPVVSGLELISLTTEKYPDVHFVVISGYRNFEYAHTAIKYGVEDYLLKPIDDAELNAVLEKICGKKREKTSELEHLKQMENRFNNSSCLLQRELLDQLRKNASTLNLIEANENYGTHFIPQGFIACVIKADRSPAKPRSSEQERLIINRIGQLVEVEFGAIADELLYAAHSGMETDVLINYGAEKKNDVHHGIHQLMTHCREYIGGYDSYDITVGTSEDTNDFSKCSELLTQAKHAMCRKLFEGTGKRIKAQAEPLKATDDSADYFSLQREMVENTIDLMQELPLNRQITQCFMSLEKRGAAAWSYYELSDNLIKLFAQWADSRGCRIEQTAVEDMINDCRSCASVSALQQCVSQKICGQLSLLRAKRQEMEERPIQDATKYIKANYGGRVSLDDVSAQCGFSATYFSELFKRKTGKTFSDYVASVRIDAAKTLLRDTRKTVYEIAEEVGYKDAKYFSQQFVKIAGIKPTEYRKLYY